MKKENSKVVAVDPNRCRLWESHPRIATAVNSETCADEIRSFIEHGQRIPVLGRALHDDQNHDVELVFGARRLFVARFLNKPLLVELRELTDQQAALALDTENQKRKNLSPYERGLCYARWLRAGHFKSQEEIAAALQVSTTRISRLLHLARLPSVIVEAFDSGLDIREHWGLELSEAIQDPARRKSIIRRAREMRGKPRAEAGEIYRQLMSPPRRSGLGAGRDRDKVIRDSHGTPLLRIRRHRSQIALILPGNRVSAEKQQRIKQEVTRILEASSYRERATWRANS